MKNKFRIATVTMSLLVAQAIKAQTGVQQQIWNAGAITVNTAAGSGQGYLVIEDGAIWLHTIRHVLSDTSNLSVVVPGVSAYSTVDPSRWRCDTSDTDYGCYFAVLDNVSDRIVAGDYPVRPFVRAREPIELEYGQIVGSPRRDTGTWTIYRITDIRSREIEIESISADTNGDGVPETLGNYCHGHSGSPVLLMEVVSNDALRLILNVDGHPYSIGELKSGIPPARPDSISRGSGIGCYDRLVVNRAVEE